MYDLRFVMDSSNNLHEHILSDGTIIQHSHDEEKIHNTHSHCNHNHSHTHTQTKAVLNRMARLIGHLESTKRMIEDGRDCSEVLIQLSAVDAALRAVGRIILKDHIEHCIVEAIQEGDRQSIEELNKAIDQFMK